MREDERSKPLALYVSDLDGTLLLPDGTLSQFAKTELNRMICQGLNFTVATARSIWAVQNILAGLKLTLPVIEMNGAFLTDFQNATHYEMWAMDPLLSKKIYSCICHYDFHPFIAVFDNATDGLYYHGLPNLASEWYVEEKKLKHDPRLSFCSDLARICDTTVISFTVFDSEQRIRLLQSVLNENDFPNLDISVSHNIYCSGWWEMNIQHALATKSHALQHLMHEKGLDAQRLTVFGDHTNDLGMFAAAGRRVAPRNAIPEILDLATETVDSNEEDGVVKFLIRDFQPGA